MLWTIGIIILLVILLWLLLQTSAFQSWATSKIGNYLGDELNTKISVERVDIEWLHKVVLEDVYIEDQKGDSLLKIEALKLDGFEYQKENLNFSHLELVKPNFNLKRYKSDSTSNLQFIIDYFKKEENSEPKNTLVFSGESINISDGSFSYVNQNKELKKNGGIDFNDLYLSNLNLKAENISAIGDSISVDIKELSLLEKSGFDLNELTGNLKLNSKKITLNNSSLRTPNSEISGNYELNYKEWNDFKNFNKKVKMDFLLDESELNTKDLAYFSPQMQGLNEVVKISGNIKGRVNNLKGKNLDLQLLDQTTFKGDLAINGLPNIEESFITLDVDQLFTNPKDIRQIPQYPFDRDQTINLPSNINKLGSIRFNGHFTGFLHDFATYGDLKTNLGTLSMDLSLNNTEAGYQYNGNLETNSFDLGEFYGIQELETVAADLNITGTGLELQSIDAIVDGKIDHIKLNDYAYQNIDVNGEFKNQFFDGTLHIDDENVLMDFVGKVDLSQSIPEYSFNADVQNIDLVNLNFIDFQDYSSLTVNISANARGSDLQDLVGDILIRDLSYCTLDNEFVLDSILINSDINEDSRKIDLSSSILTGSLEGQYDFKALEHSVELILAELIPSFEVEQEIDHISQNFELDLRVHDFSIITEFFTPDIYVAPDTRVLMSVNEETNDFELSSTADRVKLFNIPANGITLDTRKADSTIFFTLMCDDVTINEKLNFHDFSLDGRSEGDTLYTSLEWDTPEQNHAGELSGRYLVRGAKNIDYYFDRSLIRVYDEVWHFNEEASIFIDSTAVQVNEFKLFADDQIIDANGLISEDDESNLELKLQNIELANVNTFVSGSNLKFNGLINGTANLQDLYKNPLIFANLNLDDLEIDDQYIGNFDVRSEWDHVLKKIIINGKLKDENLTPIDFYGYYTPADKENPIEFKADIEELKLDFLNALIKEGISDIGGDVTGLVTISGSPSHPILNGKLKFKDAHLRVDYLNTTYRLNDYVGIYEDMFTLDNILVMDEEDNSAYAVGTIIHNNFKDWNFDVFLDTQEKDFLCMNTTESMNSIYYGKAYGNGALSVSGYAQNLELSINMKTGDDTRIALPLGSSEEVAFEDFVTFVDRNKFVTEEKIIDLTGIKLNFALDILPNAEVEIIFDEAVGDVMRGRGKGKINMNIDTRGTFEMFGNVELTEGDYLFTLKNLINKDFTVVPGGTISWFGDPMGANLDIQAKYGLTAPLYDLLGDVDPSYKNRTQVDLLMDLTGDLFSPNIGFKVNTPNVDEITKGRVQSAIDSEEETNRQAFALIALRRFVAPPNISVAHSSGILQENTSEFISSQLSNWLSQISDDFDLGINYRPGDEITNQELAVALSTQLFNDKLSVSGNFGVSQGNEQNDNPSSLIGDVRLEYKVADDGKVRLVVFNRSNDFDIASTNQNASTQGAGVLYREEFNNLEEFYCGFKNLFRKEEDRILCP